MRIDKKTPIYLLTVVPVSSGVTELRGVFTQQWVADGWRKQLSAEDEYIRVRVEKRETNHLFGISMFDSLTSDQAKKLESVRM